MCQRHGRCPFRDPRRRIDWMKAKQMCQLFCNFQGESRETKEQVKGRLAGSRALGTRRRRCWDGSSQSCLHSRITGEPVRVLVPRQHARPVTPDSGAGPRHLYFGSSPGCSALKPKIGGNTWFRDLKESLMQHWCGEDMRASQSAGR